MLFTKIIASRSIISLMKAFSKHLSVMETGENIFSGPNANETMSLLLNLKGQGISLRELLWDIPGLEYLKSANRPDDKNVDMLNAKISIINCLEGLKQENIDAVKTALARDFTILGFAQKAGKKEELTGLDLAGAVEKGDFSMVMKCITAKMSLEVTPYTAGSTVLIEAIKLKRREIIDILIQAGANVNAKVEETGVTPLMQAIRMNDMQTVTGLLAKGAIVDEADKNGYTALMIAIFNGYRKMARILLDKGASVYKKCNGGDTSLDMAGKQGFWMNNLVSHYK